jgi:hypothetical protein
MERPCSTNSEGGYHEAIAARLCQQERIKVSGGFAHCILKCRRLITKLRDTRKRRTLIRFARQHPDSTQQTNIAAVHRKKAQAVGPERTKRHTGFQSLSGFFAQPRVCLKVCLNIRQSANIVGQDDNHKGRGLQEALGNKRKERKLQRTL